MARQKPAIWAPTVATVLLACSLTACSQPAPTSDPDGIDSYVQASIDRQWTQFHESYPQFDRPVVPIVSYIAPEDWGATMLSCLIDAGFTEATLDNDGNIGMEGASAQESAFHLALYVCEASRPFARKYVTPFSDAQIDYLYDYYVDTLVPCLEAHDVAVSAAPSKQSFRETFGASSW